MIMFLKGNNKNKKKTPSQLLRSDIHHFSTERKRCDHLKSACVRKTLRIAY